MALKSCFLSLLTRKVVTIAKGEYDRANQYLADINNKDSEKVEGEYLGDE